MDLSTLANFLVAVGTFILAFYTYKLARSNDITVKNSQDQLEELKNQYKISNMREKAILLNATTIPMLKKKIDELCNYLDNNEFIKYEGSISNPIQKMAPNCFIDIVRSDIIFIITNEEIHLVYTTDEYLRKNISNAIDFLNKYHTNARELEKLINIVFSSKPPNLFIKDSKEMGLSEFGTGFTNTLRPIEDFLSVVYIVARTGSKKAYTNGSIDIINLIERRYNDLHSAAVTDPESKRIYDDIQTRLIDIKSNLTNAYYEIQKLQEIWQNEFII